MNDPVGDIIGDYRGFAAMQHERLLARGIDIGPYALSHLAVRVPEWDQYVHLRTLLERHATANDENVWNGRPISKIVLATPLEVLGGKIVSLIELIPPVHQRVYRIYVLFEDFTHVKFYRWSLYDVCVREGATFDGFVHVDDWVPQRLVTATGPNPLPR